MAGWMATCKMARAGGSVREPTRACVCVRACGARVDRVRACAHTRALSLSLRMMLRGSGACCGGGPGLRQAAGLRSLQAPSILAPRLRTACRAAAEDPYTVCAARQCAWAQPGSDARCTATLHALLCWWEQPQQLQAHAGCTVHRSTHVASCLGCARGGGHSSLRAAPARTSAGNLRCTTCTCTLLMVAVGHHGRRGPGSAAQPPHAPPGWRGCTPPCGCTRALPPPPLTPAPSNTTTGAGHQAGRGPERGEPRVQQEEVGCEGQPCRAAAPGGCARPAHDGGAERTDEGGRHASQQQHAQAQAQAQARCGCLRRVRGTLAARWRHARPPHARTAAWGWRAPGRTQGKAAIPKEIKYADQEQLFPWRPK